MRLRIAKASLAFVAGLALASATTAAPHKPRAPELEGLWRVNIMLPIEATPQTPNLAVPEADGHAIEAALRKQWTELFEKRFLDPEVPEALKSAGLPVVRGEHRTRAVVLPANGMLPYTAAGMKESASGPSGPPRLDNPEDRPGPERCVTMGSAPPLTEFIFFDTEIMILRTRDHVVLLNEYDHDARIVPITDKHLPRAAYGRRGDSIGHWEDRTLVIETVGQSDKDRDRFWPLMIVPGNAKVIERLTPVSDQELVYQFTVVDPTVYAAPWLGEFSWARTDKPIYENACHEGNYALSNILSGARYEEAHRRSEPVTAR